MVSRMRPKLAYLVTEDWYFLSHRLPMARAARHAGFDVHVLARVGDCRRLIEAEGFVLHALDWQRRDGSFVNLAAAVVQIRKVLRGINPAVLHNIALKPAIIGGMAATGLTGIAVANNINGLGSGYLAAGLNGRLQRLALSAGLLGLLNRRRTLTVVQNPADFAALCSLGLPERRLRLIAGSGVDTDRLQPAPELPLPLTVTYVGRLLADKGLRSLMAAHRIVRQRGHSINLSLAGTPDPQNATSIPQAEIDAWAHEPGVTLLGHVTDIAALWAQSHIAVLPSRREGLPLSLLEASACGRPMIATDVPGCRDVVRHGETGLLVPVDQPVPLADAIVQLANDPALRRRMAQAARKRAETEFSAEVVADQIAALYRGLASGQIA